VQRSDRKKLIVESTSLPETVAPPLPLLIVDSSENTAVDTLDNGASYGGWGGDLVAIILMILEDTLTNLRKIKNLQNNIM
jgi:hypothetical protein